jgi:hypothetical protein
MFADEPFNKHILTTQQHIHKSWKSLQPIRQASCQIGYKEIDYEKNNINNRAFVDEYPELY